MQIQNLQDLLAHEIRDLHSGESQLLDHLPQVIEKTTDLELQAALRSHLEETREQKVRLEKIASDLGIDPEGETCKGMKGILDEGHEAVESQAGDDDARDAVIIAAAQRAEHYEMAGYGSAVTYALMLDEKDVAERLQATLDEEKEADRRLTEIAEDHVNRHAMARG